MRVKPGKLIVFSAPSGTGKSTVARMVMERIDNLEFSVSATTRPMREGETDGVNYHYLSREEFEEKIRNNGFIEYEHFFGNYYGTLLDKTEEAIDAGKNLLLDLDVKGALNLKKRFSDRSLLVFLKPPSLDELKKRLKERDSEDEAALRVRLERAGFELSQAYLFDRQVVNDDLRQAVDEVTGMIADFLLNT
ncbi:guanylate kinase [Prosthecochloris sp. GSB1]|uniref:guanylate kinase n=1 Tax=Prosthecochloris sp. GSB1 TaxID=281093 RepID=UPI000B8CEAAA|nr:guanylate kinase [Prosthecochloris sp. GSB1]ASQ89868.1 guanylate kinase [Prosthecochloris sp. GSB1]